MKLHMHTLKRKRADKYVCNECVQDNALSELILEEGERRTCDYCHKKSTGTERRTLSIKELADQIHERVVWDYDDADSENLEYDGEEGAYVDDVLDRKSVV